jgi:hypothetical protein
VSELDHDTTQGSGSVFAFFLSYTSSVRRFIHCDLVVRATGMHVEEKINPSSRWQWFDEKRRTRDTDAMISVLELVKFEV